MDDSIECCRAGDIVTGYFKEVDECCLLLVNDNIFIKIQYCPLCGADIELDTKTINGINHKESLN